MDTTTLKQLVTQLADTGYHELANELLAGTYPLLPSYRKKYPNNPLSSAEERIFQKVFTWLMDIDADGDRPPPPIEKIADKKGKLTNAEKRLLINFLETTAPGDR